MDRELLEYKPLSRSMLGSVMCSDQLVLIERWPFAHLLVLEESQRELTRLELDRCDLVDLMIGDKVKRSNVALRMIKSGLQVRVSGELFAVLPKEVLWRLK